MTQGDSTFVRRARLAGLAPAALAAAAIAGCGDSSHRASSASAPAHARVLIASFEYMPATITIRAGGVIGFRDADAEPHTATASDGHSFDTRTIKTGQTRLLRISKPGSYSFYCLFHPFMRGRIIVK